MGGAGEVQEIIENESSESFAPQAHRLAARAASLRESRLSNARSEVANLTAKNLKRIGGAIGAMRITGFGYCYTRRAYRRAEHPTPCLTFKSQYRWSARPSRAPPAGMPACSRNSRRHACCPRSSIQQAHVRWTGKCDTVQGSVKSDPNLGSLEAPHRSGANTRSEPKNLREPQTSFGVRRAGPRPTDPRRHRPGRWQPDRAPAPNDPALRVDVAATEPNPMHNRDLLKATEIRLHTWRADRIPLPSVTCSLVPFRNK